MNYKAYSLYGKRIFDLVLAFILCIVFLPFYIAVSCLICLNIGTPILFKQNRPGYKGQIFKIYKFRTMTEDMDSSGNLLPDRARLKRLGKIIRSLSLDELPQLFNVLKGEMSFVGPRPLLEEYLPLYTSYQKKRHDVKPGITGWAQINGRNAITWKEKFEYDVWYVENQSLWLDIKILVLTFSKVIKRSGVTSQSSVSMEKFTGLN